MVGIRHLVPARQHGDSFPGCRNDTERGSARRYSDIVYLYPVSITILGAGGINQLSA